MKTNIKYKKAVSNSLKQDKLREKAMLSGVNLLAPETIFLSTDTSFGKNVTIEPYVVIGPKVSIGKNVSIKSFIQLKTLSKPDFRFPSGRFLSLDAAIKINKIINRVTINTRGQ